MEIVIKDITVEEFFSLKSKEKDLIIIDIRRKEEFESGHIIGALNIDYYSETYLEELSKLDKEKPCLFYCRSASRSSDTICELEKLGFKKIYNLKGGTLALEKMGYPLV